MHGGPHRGLPTFLPTPLQAKVSQSARIQESAAAQAKRQAAELAKAVAAAQREAQAAASRAEALGADVAAAQEAVAAAGQQCAALQQAEAAVRAEIEVLGRDKYTASCCRTGRGRAACAAAAHRLHACAPLPPSVCPTHPSPDPLARPPRLPQQALVATALKQREGQRWEAAEAGRYKLLAVAAGAGSGAAAAEGAGGGDPAALLAAEVDKARQKQARLRAAVAGVAAAEAAAGGGTAPQLARVLAHAAALCE